jgi:hypothetical protein
VSDVDSGPRAGGSAVGVVVGASDPEATVAFLSAFGFLESGRDGDSVRLVVPGNDSAAVEVAAGSPAGVAPRDFEVGPRALDLYTRDIAAAVAVAEAAGGTAGPVGRLALGPLTMDQVLIDGPDGFPVVLVEANRRRSSVLDDDPGRLVSEPHSVVWCVPDLDAEADRWVAAGFTKGIDLAFSEPAVSEYLGLPRSPVPIRMTMLSGPQVAPIRLELLEFPDDPADRAGAGERAIRSLVYEVADPAVTGALLGIDPTTGATPGGIAVELRQA